MTVFITNKSAHDFSAAERYGDLVFITSGMVKRYATNNMHRVASDVLKDSKPTDYIVPCSLPTLNLIVCSVFAVMHGRLNLLLYSTKGYVERTVMFK